MQKQEFVYPGSDLDRSRVLLSLLGTFWAQTYEGKDQLRSYADATALSVAQTHRNLLEVVAALSRYDVPVFHEELLVPITIKKSQLNSQITNSTQFDRSGRYLDEKINGRPIQFDVPVANDLYSFPVPAALRGVRQVLNKITFPTVVLLEEVDFVIDFANTAIRFTANPFENAAFIRRPVYAANGAADEEITLWCFCGQFDYNYIFNQFAYAVGIKLKSSETYKQLMNAVISGLVEGGASAKNLDLALSAVCGIPLTTEPEETIEEIFRDSRGLFIASDKNVYRFTSCAEPLVAIGSKTTAGTQLVRCFEVRELFTFNTYKLPEDTNLVPVPDSPTNLVTQMFEPLETELDEDVLINPEAATDVRKELLGLAMDRGFLSACFLGDLMFENKLVPVEVNTNHPSGYTYLSFGLGGFPADVRQFFDELHARGIEAAEMAKEPCASHTRRTGTLAHILDKRVQPESEPTSADLPTVINPMRFLIENVLRNNVFIVRIVVAATGPEALKVYNIRHLRRLLPPQTAMLVVFELTGETEEISGDIMIQESYTTFTGVEPQSDEINDSYLDDGTITASLLSGTCQ